MFPNPSKQGMAQFWGGTVSECEASSNVIGYLYAICMFEGSYFMEHLEKLSNFVENDMIMI